MPYILDLIVIAVVALFVWRGAARGLVLSLCGLMAFVVAFAGAGLAAQTLSPPWRTPWSPALPPSLRNSWTPRFSSFPRG